MLIFVLFIICLFFIIDTTWNVKSNTLILRISITLEGLANCNSVVDLLGNSGTPTPDGIINY